MINFNELPSDKPNQNKVEEGRYTATVFDAKMVASKSTPGTEYLNVSFKLDKGGFVNENYFDSDKPFLQYKLGRLPQEVPQRAGKDSSPSYHRYFSEVSAKSMRY